MKTDLAGLFFQFCVFLCEVYIFCVDQKSEMAVTIWQSLKEESHMEKSTIMVFSDITWLNTHKLNMNGHWIVSKKIKNFKQVMRFCHDLVSSLTFHIVIISTQTTEPIGTKPYRNDDRKILHRDSLFHLKFGCFWQFSKMTSPNNLLVSTCFMWCPPQTLLISFRLNWQKTWLPYYVYFLFSIWIWNLDCHYTRICIV